MSVYNGLPYLPLAIESILTQTFADFEFVIVDDGSTDNSREIIKSYEDPRIVLICNQENIGLTKSLNKAIHLCQGEFIARQDADDSSEPNRIEEQVKLMESNANVGLVCSWATEIDRDGNAVKAWSYPSDPTSFRATMFFYNCVIHSTALIRKSILPVTPYDESLRFAQDYNLWVDILQSHEIHCIDKELIKYRVHEESITKSRSMEQVSCVKHAQKKLLCMIGINADIQTLDNHAKILSGNYPRPFHAIRWLKKLREFNESSMSFDCDLFNGKIQYRIENYKKDMNLFQRLFGINHSLR